MKSALRYTAGILIVAFAAVLLVGCAAEAPKQTASQPAPAASPYRPIASIREVMNSIVDPSVDVVWNSVGSIVDHGKLKDNAPAKEEEWAEVRRHALVVIEAANLLMMHDRQVAPSGAGSLSPGVEATPQEIRAAIDKDPAVWDGYARAFQDALKPALAAIDAKNAEALFEAGDKIDTTCENCHQAFWYPSGIASASNGK